MHRCRESVDFSLQCAWLLDAYSSDATLPNEKKSHSTKLKNLILSGDLRPKKDLAMIERLESSKNEICFTANSFSQAATSMHQERLLALASLNVIH